MPISANARAIWITLTLPLAALMLPARASAQSRQLTEEERRLMRQQLQQLIRPPLEPRFTLSASAESTGGGELHAAGAQPRPFGEARVELDLAYESRLCRHFAAGAAASLLVDQGERAPEVEQWLAVCFISRIPLPSVELDHHLEWRRRPALSAPRLLQPGRYFKEELGLTINLFDLPFSDRQARLQFGRTRMGVIFTLHDTPEATDPFRMKVQMAMLRYLRPRFGPLGRADLTVEVVDVELEDTQGEVKDTTAASMTPVRLRGLRLGPHLLLDAAAHVIYGSIGPAYDPARANEPIPDDERRQIFTPGFEFQLYGGGARLAGGLGGRRQVWAPLSDELLIETRASAWVRYRLPRFFALLDGFVAYSEVRPFFRVDEEHVTGGGRLQLGFSPLGHERGRHAWSLWLKLSGELARSFYSGQQDPLSVIGLGAQVVASVTVSYDLGSKP